MVSELRQAGGFLLVLRVPPPIKLTATNKWNIVESGVKHHKPKPKPTNIWWKWNNSEKFISKKNTKLFVKKNDYELF